MAKDNRRDTTVSLPKSLVNWIRIFLKENPESGYHSVSDYIRHLIIVKKEEYEDREHFRRLRKR